MTKSEELFQKWLENAPSSVKEMFPSEESFLKVAKTLSDVRFRTRYNCFIDDAEHPDPVSVVEPGRSESLDHLVQRLTGRANPTALDITRLAMANGEFEDPGRLSESDIDERMERVVALGDRLQAEDVLMATVAECTVADEQRQSANERRVAKARTNESSSESGKATQIGASDSD